MKWARTFGVIALLLPSFAFAMRETVMDFRNSQLPGSWSVDSAMDPPELTGAGMHIIARKGGSLFTDISIPHKTEVIRMVVSTAVPIEANFLWHPRGDPVQSFVQLPLIIPGPITDHAFDINVQAYPQWDPYADQIGLDLPVNGELYLSEIRFLQWNIFEKTWEAAKSFWIFDQLSPISINFLWGPLFTLSPVATSELFTSLPPRGFSANRIFYAVMMLTALALAGLWYRGKVTPARSVRMFLLLFAGLWIFYQVRMGAEIISYAVHDWNTHISQPVGKRTFRTYANFSDVVAMSAPFIKGEGRYGYFGPRNTPFIAFMRYFAYPAVPLETQQLTTDIHTWLVFDRPDVTVNDSNELTIGGKPVSGPGTIVQRIDDASFVFKTLQ